ncbi:MAG: hypothetical protein GQ527_07200 [Bacteroidales bacterium]|nr:hypothetical protein [Bacteroidales bacterium]
MNKFIYQTSLILFIMLFISCKDSRRVDLDLMETGKELFFNKDFDQALLYFQKSARMNPRNDVSISYIGFCYYHISEPAPALTNFNKALRLNPSNNIALFGKSLLIWEMDDYLGAYILLDSVTNLNPKHDKAYYYKALASLQFGDTNHAIKSLEIAIENASDYPEPYYLLSSILLNKGQQIVADSLVKLASNKKVQLLNSP